MLKIKMNEFIANLMAETGKSEYLLSEVIYAITQVARKADIMLNETFNNTLESVLEVILIYPEHFDLNSHGHCIATYDLEQAKELANHWPVPEEVKKAIREYQEEEQDIMATHGRDMAFGEENISYISRDTTYIDWIWEILEKHDSISTHVTDLAENTTDLANISRLFNLYIILSRYYIKNIMPRYGDGVEEKYVFRYSRYGQERNFCISRIGEGEKSYYKVKQIFSGENFPYFPDVVMGVPCANLELKKEAIKECESLFSKSRQIGICYDLIKDRLDKAYGLYDDDDD